MNKLANAKLVLTQCIRCLGCNRLTSENFIGDNQCQSFRDGNIRKGVRKNKQWKEI
jgi:hypothetical protein